MTAKEETPEQRELREKHEKLAAGRAARKARVDEFYALAAKKRLDNELKLIEIEQRENLTLDIDLGVVWLPTGDMVAVRKPEFFDYEKYNTAMQDAKPSERPALVDEFIKPCLIDCSMQKLEEYCEICGDAKTAAVNIAIHMHDVAKKTMEGKS